MTTLPVQAADRVMERAAELATLTSVPGIIHRAYLTDAHRAANDRVAQWMREAGMSARVDAAGSVIGRLACANERAPTLLIGSHLDTIPDAGPYDGILGVLLGIEAAAQVSEHAPLPFHVEVLGFGEEEGVRFGTTLMTSRASAGSWDTRWWALKDADGVSVETAFRSFGLDPDRIGDARTQGPLLGYVEVHIEQGPVLESRDVALGVVTAIAGVRRFEYKVQGLAGHAGTVPMDQRRDALAGTAEFVHAARSLAIELGVVATVGQLQVHPGAVNVIPGEVQFSLDVRSGNDRTRDLFVERFTAATQAIAAGHQLEVSSRQIHHADAVPCADRFQQRFARASRDVGVDAPFLSSGAGHDAMAMAEVCEVGMLFVRCAGGLSHHPDESITGDDAALALAALQRFLELTAEEMND